jgi:hypothetical protein
VTPQLPLTAEGKKAFGALGCLLIGWTDRVETLVESRRRATERRRLRVT